MSKTSLETLLSDASENKKGRKGRKSVKMLNVQDVIIGKVIFKLEDPWVIIGRVGSLGHIGRSTGLAGVAS